MLRLLSLSVMHVKKFLHLCHSAGPPAGLLTQYPVSERERASSVLLLALHQISNYENYPSSRSLRLFKSHRSSYWQTSAHSSETRTDWQNTTLPTATADHQTHQTLLSLQRNTELFVRPHSWVTRGLMTTVLQINSRGFLSAGYQLSHTLVKVSCHIPLECPIQE